MESTPLATGLTPPLKLAWQNSTSLRVTAAGNGRLYGITADGSLVAINGATGELVWAGKESYLPARLALSGSELFAYVAGKGLFRVRDLGNNAEEGLLVSFALSGSTNISAPVFQDGWLFMAVNKSLVATNLGRGDLAATALPDVQPFAVIPIGESAVVTLDGKGTPTRYYLVNSTNQFSLVWNGEVANASAGQAERPYLVIGGQLLIGIGEEIVAYNLNNGRIAWRRGGMPTGALVQVGNQLYAAGIGARMAAIRLSDGAVLWERGYLFDRALQRETGLVASANRVFLGSVLQTNPDSMLLLAADAATGNFQWLSRGVNQPWVGGLPLLSGDRLFCYGGPRTGAYVPLTTPTSLTPAQITVTPRPLRGRASEFEAGQITVEMAEPARVSIAFYRERSGLASPVVSNANWGRGTQRASWTPNGAGGYTDANQFGYVQVDVVPNSGDPYTQSLLLPVNTFPDILTHWGVASIEAMIYHKLLSGYPDQMFRPDNLLTRAESCTIIAKTLGLTGPSPGFQTKFTDLAGHWARSSILALEERSIVGGFAEPDGTFTFRPDLNMTRGQEARILVVAFNIPAAPAGFRSKFTDIEGHWAKNEILALEKAGYINGFAEPNGTFTYRPDQNLTRAEICAVVVRIKNLTR